MTKPLAIGSATFAITMGIVCVSRTSAPVTGVVTLKIASGRRSTSSFANVFILSGSSPAQRSSIRRLLPSVHPSFASAALKLLRPRRERPRRRRAAEQRDETAPLHART